ncbi:hypothetical protein F5884DRAFT_815265 [Xylogone sp. PMI_703]|nr:hypothetical protein F5884DRAFT_815265 [Xylogone sp. PMI_703]
MRPRRRGPPVVNTGGSVTGLEKQRHSETILAAACTLTTSVMASPIVFEVEARSTMDGSDGSTGLPFRDQGSRHSCVPQGPIVEGRWAASMGGLTFLRLTSSGRSIRSLQGYWNGCTAQERGYILHSRRTDLRHAWRWLVSCPLWPLWPLWWSGGGIYTSLDSQG